MILFGLTGGIGMGKSAAADLLRQRELPVLDTDIVARQIVEPGQPALSEIAARFGMDMIGADGRLRRDLLADRIFADAVQRRALEAILHPRIRRIWLDQAEQWRGAGQRQGVVVIPLLYEVDGAKDVDRVVCVACTSTTQRARLAARGWSEAEISRRCAAQWPVEKKMALADYVAWSEGGLDVLAAQLDRILGLG